MNVLLNIKVMSIHVAVFDRTEKICLTSWRNLSWPSNKTYLLRLLEKQGQGHTDFKHRTSFSELCPYTMRTYSNKSHFHSHFIVFFTFHQVWRVTRSTLTPAYQTLFMTLRCYFLGKAMVYALTHQALFSVKQLSVVPGYNELGYNELGYNCCLERGKKAQ